MSKRVTSKDVAKRAGVSRATVSYILNDVKNVRIKDETRQRVLAAVNELGYHADINARAMKTNRSMSIGVMSRRNIAESRFTEVLRGIKDFAVREGYSILLCSDEINGTGHPEYYRLYQQKKLDGLIFISYQEELEKEKEGIRLDLIKEAQIPCVFADYHLHNPMLNCIDINYFHGACITAKYFLEKGHRKLAFLIPDTGTQQERQRMEGVRQAVSEYTNAELLVYNINPYEDMNRQIIEVINDRGRYTAIIVAWSYIAALLLYHASKMKLAIPGSFAVAALAEDQTTKFLYPSLTACELPLYELGQNCARILFDTIKSKGGDGTGPVNMALPCKLNIRDSG